MTEKEKFVITCAYLDLKGALEAFEDGSYPEHDWTAHKESIEDLENTFDFLTPETTEE